MTMPATSRPNLGFTTTRCLAAACLAMALCAARMEAAAQPFELQLRTRVADAAPSDAPGSSATTAVVRTQRKPETWSPAETAVIVCDMWDAHHCLNAVRRVGELAPRMNAFLEAARARGATIIHAPSSCMEFYRDHPARLNAQAVPRAAKLPAQIESWCHWKDPTEQQIGYPIDHSDGGEDDDPAEHAAWHAKLAAMGRNPGSPWIRQTPAIEIDDGDFITDDGVENWSILEQRGIKNVMLLGVHTNMCVLGRPFGLRQMARHGKHVVLVRDLTDTMYNPAMPPYVSHFSGTDLIVEHIERYVCPTITSDQILGGREFRFRQDRRPHLAILIGEDEYETDRTLPEFARRYLDRDCRVTVVHDDVDDKDSFPGIETIPDADLLLVSVRRRSPPVKQLQLIHEFVMQGKPLVGIRTASHAFALRDGQPLSAGHAVWPEFDAEVWGGNYQGHHGNKAPADLDTMVWVEAGAAQDPIVARLPGVDAAEQPTTSWLYKTSPLHPGSRVLMMGRVGDRKPHEPVTWTNIHAGGGRAFYTSLGHPDDFQSESFPVLLRRGIDWALNRLDEVRPAAAE